MEKILDFFTELNTLSIALRLVLATLLGSLVGVERANKRYAAGIRTFALVCLGSALATITGLYLSELSFKLFSRHCQNPGAAFVRHRFPRRRNDYRYGSQAGKGSYDCGRALGHGSDGNCCGCRRYLGGTGLLHTDDFYDLLHELHDDLCRKAH